LENGPPKIKTEKKKMTHRISKMKKEHRGGFGREVEKKKKNETGGGGG